MRIYEKNIKTKMNLNKMRIESNILGSFLRLTFLENFGLLRSTGYNAKYRIAGASVHSECSLPIVEEEVQGRDLE